MCLRAGDGARSADAPRDSQTAGTGARTTADNGGSAIDAYKVYYNTTATISASPYTTISSGSTFTQTVGGLTNGTLYYFWVTAHNAQGDSAASNSP